MLKNSYLEKYKIKKRILSDFEKKILSEDDNYIMKLQRPLSIKEINKFSDDKLRIFIDDIMCNKTINNLLYSSNYKNELDIYLTQKKILLGNPKSTDNLLSSTKKNNITQCESLFLQKKKTIMLDIIKNSISNFKLTKSLSMKKLKEKNKEFFKTLQNNKILNTKLFFKPVNDIRYKGYQRAFNYCLEKSKSTNNFSLPDVDLQLDNVYSRLYHNMVFSPIKLKKKKIMNKNKIKILKNIKIKPSLDIENINNTKTTKTAKTAKTVNTNKEKRKSILKNLIDDNINIKHKFKIRNIFREYKGKEFLIVQSFSNRKKCWQRNSGGPGIKEPYRGKINLNKFKIKNSKDNYYFSCDNSKEEDDIIDVNDYRDQNLNSNLHLAVKNNNEEFVKYFLNKNYNPNEKNIFGDTPLHYAMEMKNKNIIKLLMDDGGDITLKNKKGITPFDLTDREIKAYFKLGNYI